jgi:hypothetical protein
MHTVKKSNMRKKDDVVSFADLYRSTSFAPLDLATPTVDLQTLTPSDADDSADDATSTNGAAETLRLDSSEEEVKSSSAAEPPDRENSADGPAEVANEKTDNATNVPPPQQPPALQPDPLLTEQTIPSVSPAQRQPPPPPAEPAPAPQSPAQQQQPPPPAEPAPPSPARQQQPAPVEELPSFYGDDLPQDQSPPPVKAAAALFNLAPLSTAMGVPDASAPGNSAGDEVMGREEATRALTQMGAPPATSTATSGAAALPDGSVVLVVPRPGVALRTIDAACARAFLDRATTERLVETRRCVDELMRHPSSKSLDALKAALGRLGSAANCSPGLASSAAEVTKALTAWLDARESHADAMRDVARAQHALREAEASLRRAEKGMQKRARGADGVEKKALDKLKQHWSPMRDALSQAILASQQLQQQLPRTLNTQGSGSR